MSSPSHVDLQHLLAQREWLRRLSRRLLGDGPDADDLTQEALTRALESRVPRAGIRRWLAVVARNLSFEFRRGDAHRRAREEARARPEAVGDVEALERATLQRAVILVEGESAGGLRQAAILDPLGASIGYLDLEEGLGVSRLLPPGEVRLRLAGASVAAQVIEGTIVDGQTIELRATLRPGTSRMVRVHTADGSPLSGGTIVRVIDASERLVWRMNGGNFWADGPSSGFNVPGLELGWYRVFLESPDGRRGEGEIVVRSLERVDGESVEIVIE